MTGIHGLQHIQGSFIANFADDDPVRAHTQCIDHQLADGHFALAFNVGRARFQGDDMLLAKLELCSVFNRDNALVCWG